MGVNNTKCSSDPSCRNDTCVRFYKEPFFQGESLLLGLGEYPRLCELQSCKIPSGIKMTIFEGEGQDPYGGATAQLHAGLHKTMPFTPLSVRIEDDAAFWCATDPFDQRCFATIEPEKVSGYKATYCSNQSDIFNNSNCMLWCQQNPGQCDQAFMKVCASPPNQHRPECACFLPAEFYENLSAKLTSLGHPPILRPSCSYDKCTQSPMQPAAALTQKCPDMTMNNVKCSLVVDNDGTINANVMDMDIKCTQTNLTADTSTTSAADTSTAPNDDAVVPAQQPANNNNTLLIVIIAIVVVVVVIVISVLYMRKF